MELELRDLLANLHTLTVKDLADIIENGIPVVNPETGEATGRMPAPAAYHAQVINLLKHNNIQAPAVNKGVKRLTSVLAAPYDGLQEESSVLPFPKASQKS